MASERVCEKIVVGVDASPESLQALRWAARQAERVGAQLTAVTVWTIAGTIPMSYGWLIPLENVDWVGNAEADLEKMILHTLGDAAAERVRREVVEGQPAHRLLEAAADADLLVVGSHGHSAIAEVLIGSVAMHVVTHARCPVVVVHGTSS